MELGRHMVPQPSLTEILAAPRTVLLSPSDARQLSVAGQPKNIKAATLRKSRSRAATSSDRSI